MNDIEELEKENAELKAFRQDCVKLTEDNVVMARQRAETAKQLTIAKELLGKFMPYVREAYLNQDIDNLKLSFDDMAKAEQFLKENIYDDTGNT